MMVEPDELPAETVTLVPERVKVFKSPATVNDSDPLEEAKVESPE